MTVHFVKGVDPILRDEAVDALVGELLGDDDRSFALEEFAVGVVKGDDDGPSDDSDDEPTGTPFAAALNAARTPPMMTAKRVVLVRDVGYLSKAEVDALGRYAETPVDTTELVLSAGGSGNRVKSTLTAIEKLVSVIGKVTSTASEKPADVLDRALASTDIRLRPDATKRLLAHVGSDAGLLPALIETLGAVYGPGAQLGVDEIEPYLNEAGTVPNWDLTNAIEKGDTGTALAVLQRLTTSTTPTQPKPLHPLQILAMLHGYYRRLLQLDDPSIRNGEDAAAALGGRTSPKAASFRLRQARLLGTDGLRQAFDHLARADLDLKGERSIPEDAVLEILVTRLATLTTRASARRT